MVPHGVYTASGMPPQPPTGTEDELIDDVEEVTGEPVLDGREPVPPPAARRPESVAERPGRARSIASAGAGNVVVQAAAVAATGLVAGAATTALVRAARGRRASSRSPRSRTTRDGVEVLETRTYVVDVHVLQRR